MSRAPVAALLSAIVPGLGHRYIRKQKLANILFALDIALVLSLTLVVAKFRIEALGLLVSPNALLVLMLVNIGLLIFRAAVVSGAYTSATVNAPGLSATVGMVLAIALLVVPHLAFGYLAWTQYDLIKSVFVETPPLVGAPADTTSTTAGTPAGIAPTSSPTTTIPEPTIWDGVERLNVLLLGSDIRPDQEQLDPGHSTYRGHRTDTIIVVSINPSPPYDVAMFSVPRFLSNYPLPEGMGDGRRNNDWDWLGHLYRRAEDGSARERALYPGPASPGINALKGALGELFGISIHHYALVSVNGFINVVDALGGVRIDVPRTIIDRDYDHANQFSGADSGYVIIEEGRQHLDGFHALAYARIRSQSNEFARMHRQRCVLEALVAQANPIDLLRGFGQLADTIKNYVKTDIPQERLVDFVNLLPTLSTDNFSTLRITLDYEIAAPPGNIRWFDVEQIRADSQFLLQDPVAARQALGLNALDATCEETFDPVQTP